MKKSKVLKYFTSILSTNTLFIPLVSCKEECTHDLACLFSLFNNNQPGAIYKCPKCRKFIKKSNPTPLEINMPVINISGDFSCVSKDTKTKMTCVYTNPLNNQTIRADCTIKIQGQFTTSRPKKNYNIQFFKSGTDYKNKLPVDFNQGWTKESKYTLKANHVDWSHLRNVVCAKIIGKTIKENKANLLSNVVNGGCQDGFPLVLYQNDVFHGVYMVNIAKDKQLYKSLDETLKPKYFLSAGSWSDACHLRKTIDSNFNSGIENEYCDGNVEDMVTSFNNLINFGINATDEEFKANINNYFDLDAAIDYIIFCETFLLYDNSAKNANFVSFDGAKWFITLYDMDASLGLSWDGLEIPHNNPFDTANMNNILSRIALLYKNDIKDRYIKYRQTTLSTKYVHNVLTNLDKLISTVAKNSDFYEWHKSRQTIMTLDYIKQWIQKRLEWLDNNLTNIK